MGTIIAFCLFWGLFIFICGIIAKKKNISRWACLFGLLHVIGIIVVALMRPNYVACPMCGYRFNPAKKQCPVCGASFQKVADDIKEDN